MSSNKGQGASPFQSLSKNLWSLLSGAISGAISRSAVAPIERIIILRQTKNQKYVNLSFYQSIAMMYSSEGMKSLFKGNGANCIRIAPFQAIEFFMFEYYKHIVDICFGLLFFHLIYLLFI
jgi:solute carrier family 25 phosphate transporter 23/24/25/41